MTWILFPLGQEKEALFLDNKEHMVGGGVLCFSYFLSVVTSL